MAASLVDTVWSPSFWLPEGSTWADYEPKSSDVYIPRIRDINWSLVVGLALLVLRYFYERVLIVPIGRFFGVKERKRHVTPNPILEQAFKGNKGKLSKQETELLVKKTDKSQREIERWFFKRRLKDAPSSMMKFRECSWHFIFYFTAFVYGMYILWNRNWFWETKYCWINYPQQHVDVQLQLFYLIELGFYWSLLFSSLTDIKRTDFWEMFSHHVITIALIYFSWSVNFVRIGALIIVVHDVSDYWMAAAKMAKYSNRQNLCEALFTCFIIFWIISRVIIYPFWIVWAVAFELPQYVQPFMAHKLFLALLCGLLVLHTFWTFLILKIALQKFTHGALQKDVRSDSESFGDLSDSETDSPSKAMNGTKANSLKNNNTKN